MVFFISLLFYIIGKRCQKLCYEIETYPIISDKVSQVKGLEIKYHSKEIDNLYYSIITICNIGNTIIEKSDFAPSCPLSVSTDGYFLVDENNKMDLFSSNRLNNISHTHVPTKTYPIPHFYDLSENDEKRKSIIINFDYIARNEEITCALFHTGNISFDGVLKDGKITDLETFEPRKGSVLRALLILLGYYEC